LQEQLVRDFGRNGGDVTVIRPGAVYGPGQLRDAGMCMRLFGERWLAIAPRASLKLTYVENCADAILLAVEQPAAIGETFDIVDPDSPGQRGYTRALRRHGLDAPRSIPVPYRLARAAAGAVDLVNRSLLGG